MCPATTRVVREMKREELHVHMPSMGAARRKAHRQGKCIEWGFNKEAERSTKGTDLQCNSVHIYSEVKPTVFAEAYSQENVHRIEVLIPWPPSLTSQSGCQLCYGSLCTSLSDGWLTRELTQYSTETPRPYKRPTYEQCFQPWLLIRNWCSKAFPVLHNKTDPRVNLTE